MIVTELIAKSLLRPYGLPIPPGLLAETPAEAEKCARQLGGPAVVKALIPMGGRGKAGGVKVCAGPGDAGEFAAGLLGSELLGHSVEKLLVETPQPIGRETYAGIFANTAGGCFDLIFSLGGGVEIENLAQGGDPQIHRLSVDPFEVLPVYKVKAWLKKACLEPAQLDSLARILATLHRAAADLDAMLLEINPLAILTDGDFCLLDCKLDVDDSSLYRHPELKRLYLGSLGPVEAKAQAMGVSYVPLAGEIGLITSGAGLGMASIDMLQAEGLKPANFLDTGGGISTPMMKDALTMVLSPAGVKGALVNLYGGINRMLDAALGIEAACNGMSRKKPVVVKIRGNQQEEAWEVLEKIPQVEVIKGIRTEDAVARLKEKLG